MEVNAMESVKKTASSPSPVRAGIIVSVPLLFATVAYTRSFRNRLRHASQPGRSVSAEVSSTTATPLTTINRSGRAGDPINIQISGTDGQIGAAFASAGWYRADEIDFITSVRISADSLLGRKYSTAPVSNLYLYGRKEDMAFERPGSNVRMRDHIRIWNTGQNGEDKRPTWIGSVTKDIKVELSRTDYLPTHGIGPDLDSERTLLVSALAKTGFVVKETTRPGFGKETQGVNGGGDPYFTDGQVVVLTLANVPTLPLATQVRGPFIARIAKTLSKATRWRLPQAGLERAERARQHSQA
jgi:LssY C-terminus